MPLVIVISGIIFFLLLILFIIRYGVIKQKPEDELENQSIIHTSGIYSIVRKSPRENIDAIKPTSEEISQYLHDQTVDIENNEVTEQDKRILLSFWHKSLDNAINEIEEGDKRGIEFYYYDFLEEDVVCKKFISKGHYITRENIYAHPELIPPFHLGCKCILKHHEGTEVTPDTAKLGLRPFLQDEELLPALPNWKHILKT